MISTQTRGVGINRNLALSYATADYCLFGDDDVTYVDNVEELVVKEFEAHPDADVFIFNLHTKGETRKQKIYSKTKKHRKFEKMPWGGCRIAVKLSSAKKANIWFNTLFGGGCIFPSGEDSLWLIDAKRKDSLERCLLMGLPGFLAPMKNFITVKVLFIKQCIPKHILYG